MLCGGGTRLACLLFAVGGLAVIHPLAAQEAPVGAERGSIRGTVVDQATGQPIIGAHVAVVGAEETARTDVDGQFDVVLPPGTYQVRVSAPLYETKRVDGVAVQSGAPARVAVSLKAKVDTSVEVVEVVADVAAATEAAQLLKRKMAPTVSDNLGAEAIAKTPDSDAAEVVTRVPAVTIKDDKFIVVRGLNERYSSALLNGSRLPSTDPNRRVVPLDLFPTDFIESLSVIKSYTPDLPGDFSGGLVDLRLADPPPHLSYGIGLASGINTETTFQSFDSYHGSTLDWFGFGDDYRSLPDIFGDTPKPGSDAPTKGPTTPQMQRFVRSLRNNWDLESETAPPNFGIDAAVGDTIGPWGFNLAANYGTKHQVRRDEVQNGFQETDLFEQGLGDIFTIDRSTFETELGAIATTSYKPSPSHKLAGRALFNRKATDEVIDGEGIEALFDPNKPIFTTSAIYTVDQLGFGQLEGRHHWSLFDVDWRTSWGTSSEEQPDGKFTRYELEEGETAPRLVFKSPSTLRTFATLDEFLQDYYVDFLVPFPTRLPFTDVWRGLSASFKAGLAFSLRDRNFDFRRFRTDSLGPDLVDRTQPPDDILRFYNYSTAGPLTFTELTNPSDQFKASQEIAAAYGMFELPLVRERLRLVGGARVEYSYLTSQGYDRGQIPFENHLNDLDPLPGVSLIYSPLEDMNVRLAYSQTVSRPEFRELTPTQFPGLPGQRTIQGNPDLTSASITSYDARWEWFFSPLELASASFFYKQLTDPIEIVSVPETSALLDSFVNAEDATVWGFEFEVRKDFNFLVPYVRRWDWAKNWASLLGDVTLNTNVSVIESNVRGIQGTDTLLVVVTNDERPLNGQAPFVVNASIEYEHYRWGIFRMLYNTVGRTITAAGVDIQPEDDLPGLPDIYQERRDQLDFVWIAELAPFGTPVQAKFAVENILNDEFLETQGSETTSRYRTGQTFSVGLSYKF